MHVTARPIKRCGWRSRMSPLLRACVSAGVSAAWCPATRATSRAMLVTSFDDADNDSSLDQYPRLSDCPWARRPAGAGW